MQRDVQLVTQRQQLLHSCCIAWIHCRTSTRQDNMILYLASTSTIYIHTGIQ
jgi:hypothetical protein